MSPKQKLHSRTELGQPRYLIVTHQGPDLDACGAVWLLQRFSSEVYASSQVAFVPAGKTLTDATASKLGYTPEYVIHVDTGLGQFDHHQPARAILRTSASQLVYDDLCQHYPHLQADGALRLLVEHITDIDHFGEVSWPEAGHLRYSFMLHELLNGLEHTNPHNDDMLLRFCQQALDAGYVQLKQNLKAGEIVAEKGLQFEVREGRGLALETANDETLAVAQKQGYVLVIKKDPAEGFVRIKARPDSSISLEPLYQRVLELDQEGTWFYHQSGKMLLNNSRKNSTHKPTPLSLETLLKEVKNIYG